MASVTAADLECPLCLQLLCDPITTACGHTSWCVFRTQHDTRHAPALNRPRLCSRNCLTRSLQEVRKECPTCRTPCYIAAESAPGNVLLRSLAEKSAPELYAARDREAMQERIVWGTKLPIFCMNEPLFPGQPLSLHLFEPRYRLMLERIACAAVGHRRFGYVCTYAPGVGSVGTIAEIISVQHLPGGTFVVRARGGPRFALTEHWVEEGMSGLHYGRVSLLPDEDAGGVQALARVGAVALAGRVQRMGGHGADATRTKGTTGHGVETPRPAGQEDEGMQGVESGVAGRPPSPCPVRAWFSKVAGDGGVPPSPSTQDGESGSLLWGSPTGPGVGTLHTAQSAKPASGWTTTTAAATSTSTSASRGSRGVLESSTTGPDRANGAEATSLPPGASTWDLLCAATEAVRDEAGRGGSSPTPAQLRALSCLRAAAVCRVMARHMMLTLPPTSGDVNSKHAVDFLAQHGPAPVCAQDWARVLTFTGRLQGQLRPSVSPCTVDGSSADVRQGEGAAAGPVSLLSFWLTAVSPIPAPLRVRLLSLPTCYDRMWQLMEALWPYHGFGYVSLPQLQAWVSCGAGGEEVVGPALMAAEAAVFPPAMHEHALPASPLGLFKWLSQALMPAAPFPVVKRGDEEPDEEGGGAGWAPPRPPHVHDG